MKVEHQEDSPAYGDPTKVTASMISPIMYHTPKWWNLLILLLFPGVDIWTAVKTHGMPAFSIRALGSSPASVSDSSHDAPGFWSDLAPAITGIWGSEPSMNELSLSRYLYDSLLFQ